ncbi:MAG: AMP-binding protein, partial [Gemmataceae bacterium]
CRFLVYGGHYKNFFLRLFFSILRHQTLRIDGRRVRPHAIRDALDSITAALNQGELVMVFPEGRLTRTSQMRPFHRGLELAAKRANRDVPIVPMTIVGLWGSLWSYSEGRLFWKWPQGFRRRVTVRIGPMLLPGSTVGEARAAIAELQARIAIDDSADEIPVHRWYLRSWSRWRQVNQPCWIDVATGSERIITGGRGIVATWSLARWLQPRLTGNEPVGIWLPTGLGSTLVNIALAFLRRTSVNLNYTAGADAVAHATTETRMRFIITSRRFTEKMPLNLPEAVQRIDLEDALAGIPGWQKTLRFLAVLLLPARCIEWSFGLHRTQPDDVLTIIYSSGTTGTPKGVMLTHRNIASNAHAFHNGVALKREDRMLATLPFFHSFGYTVCLWAPAGIGMLVVFYPDPRAGKEIGELCLKHQCTIQLGTATFLRFYLRRSSPSDFQSLRLLICGAEKLPVSLAKEFAAKFGILPLEGYGCTETAPAVSLNLPDTVTPGCRQVSHRPGSIGLPIPGVVVKAFDPETLAPLPVGTEGVLGVLGPNVMLGYFQQPERTAAAIHHGWYITGDMGVVEPEGFLRITGRISRFAKIAGEMIPLEKVEELLQEALGGGDRQITVCS